MMRSLLTAFIILLFASAAYTQGRAIDNDEETLTFGYMFQYISSELKVYKKASWRDPYFDNLTGNQVTDSLTSISASSKPGFGLGFLANLRLSDHSSFRFNPGLAFTDRLVKYEYPAAGGTSVVERTVQATMIDLPLSYKLQSDLRSRYRAYFLTGVKYSTNILSKKKFDDSGFAPDDKLLKNKNSFFSYEAGIGFDLYFEFFKLSPEIKFSQSIGDVLQRENSPYAAPIDKLFLRSIQFSLLFQ